MAVVGCSIIAADAVSQDAMLGVIARSFAADPFLRWMLPGDDAYRAAIPDIFAAFALPAIAGGTAFMTADGRGVALWLAPGVAADNERFSAALREGVAPGLRAQVGAVFEAMGKAHADWQGCWNLPMIGVDPAMAGRGHGTALMRFGLSQCDARRGVATLDSSNPRNLPFYERLGFRAVAAISHGSSPVISPMIRPACAG